MLTYSSHLVFCEVKLIVTICFSFAGYANEDFVGIPYPVLKDFSPVTPEQAYLTLGYFRELSFSPFYKSCQIITRQINPL